jgi:hypothetical protein
MATTRQISVAVLLTGCVVILALCETGCTSRGNVKQKVYMDSNNSNKAYIGYDIPIP